MSFPLFEVVRPGALTVFQDRGRFGLSGFGVSPSGAWDLRSAAKANRALGNSVDAPVLEILGGGFAARALAPATVLLTGAQAEVAVSGRRGFTHSVLDLAPGDTLELGDPESGCRTYLAVRGGFSAPAVLGSHSLDLLSGIGPAPVAASDVLFGSSSFVETHAWYPMLRQLPPTWSRLSIEPLKVIIGPREDWFTVATVERFFNEVFTVSLDSNRVGLRLAPRKPLAIKRGGELPSEGMVRGAIQVPRDGNPVVFGPDHPVTGGYPVIGVLDEESADRCAQLVPGQLVHFEEKVLD